MPERPFFKKTVEELEEMYAQGKDDKKLVTQLLSELKHRKTQRAQKLKTLILEAGKIGPILDIPADPALVHDNGPGGDKGPPSVWDSITKAISSLKH